MTKSLRSTWTRTDCKPCSKCGEVKDLDSFTPCHRGGFLGRLAICKVCNNAREKKLRDIPDNRNKRREYERSETRKLSVRTALIKRTYGDRGLELDKKRDNGEPCAACGGYTETMNIDHDHETGITRDLLCTNCNFALGYVMDDPKRLIALVDYLAAWGRTL